jgi:ATP phosphoribosyltransferase regulatory subunit
MKQTMKPFLFEKPAGFRDLSPALAAKKRWIEQQVQTLFIRWGYEEVYTPTLEFYDTVGRASAIPEQKMFKCMDCEGYALILRPDQTVPIARLVASMPQVDSYPLRLFYHGSVFRAQEQAMARKAELFQSGVELIGKSGAAADAEMIALSIEALLACQLESFHITMGHIQLLDRWLEERLQKTELILQLKDYLSKRDIVGFRRQIEHLAIAEEFLCLLHLYPDRDHLNQLQKFTNNPSVLESIQYIDEVWGHLEDYGFDAYLSFDPSLIGGIGYYTGIYFEGYALGQGFPVLSGGRYDRLFQQFQTDLPATGFSLKIDRFIESSPLAPEPAHKITLMYECSVKKKAIQQARQLRAQGNIVILVSLEDGKKRMQHDRNMGQIQIMREGDESC